MTTFDLHKVLLAYLHISDQGCWKSSKSCYTRWQKISNENHALLARAAGLLFGGQLATTLVATNSDIIFLSPRFSVVCFSHRRITQIKKTYLAKVDGGTQKPLGRPLSRPHQPFWDPLAAILDFAGGAALQAVSECPLRR